MKQLHRVRMYKRLKECATPGSIANLDLSLHIWPVAISHNLRSINRIFSLGFSEFGYSMLNSLRFDWRSRKWGSLFGSLHSRGKKEKIDFFGILQWCIRGFEAGRLNPSILLSVCVYMVCNSEARKQCQGLNAARIHQA